MGFAASTLRDEDRVELEQRVGREDVFFQSWDILEEG